MRMDELPMKRTFTWPIWGNEESFLVSVKDITGAVAMWAVKQSPYSMPENLAEGLSDLGKKIASDLDFKEGLFARITIEELRTFLIKAFEGTPSIVKWNTPNIDSGSEYLFTDRYHEVNPDYDFIDLGALARNVAHTVGRETFY